MGSTGKSTLPRVACIAREAHGSALVTVFEDAPLGTVEVNDAVSLDWIRAAPRQCRPGLCAAAALRRRRYYSLPPGSSRNRACISSRV